MPRSGALVLCTQSTTRCGGTISHCVPSSYWSRACSSSQHQDSDALRLLDSAALPSFISVPSPFSHSPRGEGGSVLSVSSPHAQAPFPQGVPRLCTICSHALMFSVVHICCGSWMNERTCRFPSAQAIVYSCHISF